MHRFIRRKDLPYILFTMILGSLNHFLYKYSGENPLTALIAPISESVWEHMKLLFFPFLLFTLIQYFFQRPEPASFFASRIAGIWTGMVFVILLYYGYSGILGRNYGAADIFLFFVGVVIAYRSSAKWSRILKKQAPLNIFLCWAAAILLFFFFTCFPPELPLFLPPSG